MQVCRICAVAVDEDATSHILIKNNKITELGEKFISCLGIQVSENTLIELGFCDQLAL